MGNTCGKDQSQQQQQQQSLPPQPQHAEQREGALHPSAVLVNVMEGQPGSTNVSGAQWDSTSSGSPAVYSAAAAPATGSPFAAVPPGGVAAPAPAAAGVSFSAWNPAGASSERNRLLVQMTRLIHEALLDEPQTSESLRLRAQQALRQTERELSELHAMPRLHGLHFSTASAPEAAIVSQLDKHSPAMAQGVDLKKGDRLVSVEGVTVLSAQHAAMLLTSMLCLPGQSVELCLQRGSSLLRTSLLMGAGGGDNNGNLMEIQQHLLRINNNCDFITLLRREVEQQREADQKAAADRAREAEAVQRAAEAARIRQLQQEEQERAHARLSAQEDASNQETLRARKLEERAARLQDESDKLAYRSMMLVLARVANASSSSLNVAAASQLDTAPSAFPAAGGEGMAAAANPPSLKDTLQAAFLAALHSSGCVAACLYGEEGVSVPASGAAVPVLVLANAKLNLAQLQEALVARALQRGVDFTRQSQQAMTAEASAWLAEYRHVQQTRSLQEEQRAEQLRLRALADQAHRQEQLDMMQRQIAANKAAAVVSAMDARRASAAAHAAPGWEGTPAWANR